MNRNADPIIRATFDLRHPPDLVSQISAGASLRELFATSRPSFSLGQEQPISPEKVRLPEIELALRSDSAPATSAAMMRLALHMATDPPKVEDSSVSQLPENPDIQTPMRP